MESQLLAYLTIAAAVISFVVGTVFNINIGILCVITGFIASIIAGGNGGELIASLSASNIIMLLGVMYMFTVANKNGTMEKICSILLKLAKGKKLLMPLAFAITGGIVCGVGAGGASTSALLASPSANMAKKTGLKPMLMTATTMHGIFAGQFTPVSSAAIPILAFLAGAGYGGLALKLMIWNIVIEFLAVVLSYFVFGGKGMLKGGKGEIFDIDVKDADTKFTTGNWVTIICIAILIYVILGTKFNVGLTALLLGTVMILVDRKNGLKDVAVIKAVPWQSLVMVIGAMTLLDMMADAGGTTLIVNGIQSLNIGLFGLLLLIAASGLISFYATSVPVILALLPLGIELCNNMGLSAVIPGLVVAICIAGTIVDVSPMSNSGALFLAASSSLISDEAESRKLFRTQFLYGFVQIALSAVFCWLIFVVLGL